MFFDLSIEVHDRKLTSKLNDKKCAFLRYNNRRLYFDSNIPIKIFYASIASEILRDARTVKDVIYAPWAQDANWKYIRRSEDVLHIFWTSSVCSIYVLCPGGMVKRVEHLLMQMRKQGSECIFLSFIISLLKKIFGKQFKSLA